MPFEPPKRNPLIGQLILSRLQEQREGERELRLRALDAQQRRDERMFQLALEQAKSGVLADDAAIVREYPALQSLSARARQENQLANLPSDELARQRGAVASQEKPRSPYPGVTQPPEDLALLRLVPDVEGLPNTPETPARLASLESAFTSGARGEEQRRIENLETEQRQEAKERRGTMFSEHLGRQDQIVKGIGSAIAMGDQQGITGSIEAALGLYPPKKVQEMVKRARAIAPGLRREFDVASPAEALNREGLEEFAKTLGQRYGRTYTPVQAMLVQQGDYVLAPDTGDLVPTSRKAAAKKQEALEAAVASRRSLDRMLDTVVAVQNDPEARRQLTPVLANEFASDVIRGLGIQHPLVGSVYSQSRLFARDLIRASGDRSVAVYDVAQFLALAALPVEYATNPEAAKARIEELRVRNEMGYRVMTGKLSPEEANQISRDSLLQAVSPAARARIEQAFDVLRGASDAEFDDVFDEEVGKLYADPGVRRAFDASLNPTPGSEAARRAFGGPG